MKKTTLFLLFSLFSLAVQAQKKTPLEICSELLDARFLWIMLNSKEILKK